MRVKEPINLGQLAGIPVILHPICLIYLPLSVLILALGPLAAESADGPLTKWSVACVTVGLMATSVFLHELGHLVTAVYYRLPLRQTTLYPFGGIAHMGCTPIPSLPFIMMILAGPFASLVQAIIWLGIWLETNILVCLWLAQFNGAMALLSLLPIARLDGGNLLLLLVQSFSSLRLARFIGFLMSVYLPLGFTLSGSAAIMVGLPFSNMPWILAGLLLVLTGLLFQAELDYVMLSCTPDQLKKLKRTSVVEICTQLSAHTVFEKVKTSRANSSLLQYETTTPFSFSADTNGLLLEREKPKQFPTLKPWLVNSTTPLLQALYKLDSVRASTLLIVEDSQVIGTVSYNQILQYLTAEEEIFSLKPTPLFMLLKSNWAVDTPLHLS